MQSFKFSLADVILLLAAMIYGVISYLSLNFLFLGDRIKSIFWASLIAVILFGIAYGLRLLKGSIRSLKISLFVEGLFLLMFIGAAFISFFTFSHFFTVLGNKEKIFQILDKSMAKTREMFDTYETYTDNRLNLYENNLSSAVATKFVNTSEYRKFGFVPGISETIQIQNKLDILNKKLKPEEFFQIKDKATEWLANANLILKDDWAFTFGVIKLLNILQPVTDEWKNQLSNFSNFKAQGEVYDNFEYEIEFNQVKNLLTEPEEGKKLSAIIIAILLYSFMLFSYLIADRKFFIHSGNIL
jgi:hypothetical protein